MICPCGVQSPGGGRGGRRGGRGGGGPRVSAVPQQVLLAPGAVSHLRPDTRLRAAPRQVLTLRDLLALTLFTID